MNDNERILTKEFESLKDDLIAKYDQLGMRASGQFASELEVKVNDTKAQLWGVHYTEYLIDGRKPGKFPPIASIEKWIIDKGISAIEADISISSLAFLIARKIAKEGTEYYKQGGTDLIDDVFTPARIQSIIDQLTFIVVDDFVFRGVETIKQAV
jgi:hypothetical protein